MFIVIKFIYIFCQLKVTKKKIYSLYDLSHVMGEFINNDY